MKGTKIIFKGKLISLFEQKKRLSNGHIVNLEIVKHPGAALIIPFLDKNRIILLRQYRPVIDSYIYELPAGTLKKGESPISCARREIIEETGYSAKRFTKLGEIFPAPGYTTERITIYKAEGLTKRECLAEKDEIIQTFIFNKPRIKKLFKAKKIIDAKTISGLCLCGWL